MKRCYGCMHEFDDEFELCPHCGFIVGTMPEIKSHLPCGTKLSGGRYILGKVLGHGGFGITYIAWDSKRSRPVAVKEFFPNALSTRCEGETVVSCYNAKSEKFFREGVRKMLDEGESLSRFYKNDNIVNVYDFFEANKTAYIVMEYLEGKDLKKYLEENGGKLDVEESIEIILPVLNALIDMHSENLIHRDVSPDNIFICNNGKVKLLDFGSARLAVQDADKSISVMVKKGYAPKEQYASRSKQGPWTDVYAVSATLYELITGQKPADSMERDETPLKTFKELGVIGRGDLEKIIAKGLEPEIADRIQDAATLYALLADVLNPGESPNPDLNKKDKSNAFAKRSKKPLIIAAVCIAAVVAGVIGGKFITDKIIPKNDEITTTQSETTTESVTETTVSADAPMLSKTVPLEGVEGLTKTEILNTVLGENENVYMADINGDGSSEIIAIDESGVSAYTTLADGSVVKTVINCAPESEFWADSEKNALVIVNKSTASDGICYSAAKLSVADAGFAFVDAFSVDEDDIESTASAGAVLSKVKAEFDAKYAEFTKGLDKLVDLKTLNVSGECGISAKWLYHKGGNLLRILGTGGIDGSRGDSLSPWEEIKSEVKMLMIGNSIISIGDNAFEDFASLEEVYIGSLVNRIESYAFSGCSSLRAVKIPDGVEIAEERIFDGSGVEEIYIGKGLDSVEPGAFSAPNVIKITADAANRNFESDISGVLYTEGMLNLVQYPLGSSASKYEVNASTQSIYPYAFQNAGCIETIGLPSGLDTIGKYAFSGCSALASATVPGSVYSIPEGAFAECTGLESVILENGVSEIGQEAFRGCTSLKAISLPDSMKTIGRLAFSGCTRVTALTIPANVNSMGSAAFDGWTSSQTINIGIRQANNWPDGWNGKASLSYRFS